jgi:hypothetical protein
VVETENQKMLLKPEQSIDAMVVITIAGGAGGSSSNGVAVKTCNGSVKKTSIVSTEGVVAVAAHSEDEKVLQGDPKVPFHFQT